MTVKNIVPHNQVFEDNLRRLMVAAGISTGSQLARRMKVTPQAVSKWMSGFPPTEEKMTRLAKLLEVTPAYLRYGYSPVNRAVFHKVMSELVRLGFEEGIDVAHPKVIAYAAGVYEEYAESGRDPSRSINRLAGMFEELKEAG